MSSIQTTDREVNPLTVQATLTRPYLLLWGMGYSLPKISEILGHVSIYGTTEGCPEFVSDVHQQIVEDSLPDSPQEEWARYEAWRFRTT